jgi:MFS family permease
MTVDSQLERKPDSFDAPAVMPPPAPAINPIRIPDFRLLWVGATAVSLGVQFYAVGVVWLVLYLTGSGLQLGTLLTVAAVPRAISMLLSGALIDRYPPRRILMYSTLFNAAIMAFILLLLGGGGMSMIALFIIAPLNGLIDAVFYPVNSALIPRLVSSAQLARANAMIQTADTLANIAGPTLGGIIIGEIGRMSGSPVTGLMAGFGVNTVLFVVGLLAFLNLSARTDVPAQSGDGDAGDPSAQPESLWKSVLSGIRYALTQTSIRVSLLMIALLNFAAIGPIVVGGALLVERRFGGDATMYGIMSGGFGVGMLVGGVVITAMGQMKRPGIALISTAFALGIGLVILGFAQTFWVAFAVSLGIGVFAAVTNVNAITWMQLKTEPAMQGRIASLLVFAAVALDPFSNGISGVIAEFDLTLLYCAAGALVILGGIVALFNPNLREEV